MKNRWTVPVQSDANLGAGLGVGAVAEADVRAGWDPDHALTAESVREAARAQIAATVGACGTDAFRVAAGHLTALEPKLIERRGEPVDPDVEVVPVVA